MEEEGARSLLFTMSPEIAFSIDAQTTLLKKPLIDQLKKQTMNHFVRDCWDFDKMNSYHWETTMPRNNGSTSLGLFRHALWINDRQRPLESLFLHMAALFQHNLHINIDIS